jgi:large subunit ribosomal protein L17
LAIAPTPYTASIAPQFIAPQDKAAEAAPEDNLELIEGIGPRIAGVLRAAGISTFVQLAETTEDRLEKLLNEARLPFSNPGSWMEQARLAGAGDWDGLKVLQDRLKGGR